MFTKIQKLTLRTFTPESVAADEVAADRVDLAAEDVFLVMSP